MMKAESCTRLNNLLNIGIPKSKRDDRSHFDTVEYVDPAHIVCVTAFCGCAGNDKQFCGKDELPVHIAGVTKACSEKPKSRYDRKMLLELLNNIDSDNVNIYMDEDHPIMIEGFIEEKILIQGCIAPIIGDEVE